MPGLFLGPRHKDCREQEVKVRHWLHKVRLSPRPSGVVTAAVPLGLNTVPSVVGPWCCTASLASPFLCGFIHSFIHSFSTHLLSTTLGPSQCWRHDSAPRSPAELPGQGQWALSGAQWWPRGQGQPRQLSSQGGLLAEVIFRKLFFNLIFRGKVINRCVWLKKKKKR